MIPRIKESLEWGIEEYMYYERSGTMVVRLQMWGVGGEREMQTMRDKKDVVRGSLQMSYREPHEEIEMKIQCRLTL